MKSIFLTAGIVIISIFSCHQTASPALINSLWKIRKVEILKNNQLKKTIDTGYQYWSFKKKSMIEIFNTGKIQNVLHVQIGNSSIRSYDVKGKLQEEFVIEEMGDDNMALSSKKKVENAEYNVIYYLDKVKDTAEDKLMQHY
jgi:hypothetical protein